ncbi:Biopterin-dependent aromatic amino acid hydroxylase [Oesophagostomum dentatum]|uniref:Biopterin-dependent aromatic amino acid hydroxylase n=1 Tax=Oesophagostomum dentatum TaxID=61180 RepID=A0A0B1SG04_OESDE|nr:Biopterin-dependent aromatic amino acid hydroxylase [Oesophagostomum dentatum]
MKISFQILQKLNDEGVELIWAADKGSIAFTSVLSSSIPWFPRHISELDKCSRCITKYDPTTDPRHPGHGDDAYIARRQFLNDQALEYKHGDPIPLVDYTEEEHATWRAVYEKLRGLHESHTCEAYRRNFKMLEEAGVLTADRIPQIRDVNKYLQSKGPRCN